jgi:hypothetical protein
MTERWAARSGAFLHRVLDDDILVYCHASGATHRFADAEAWVFEQLLAGEAELDQLAAAAVAVAERPAPREELAGAIRGILRMFEDFGLVSRLH